MHSDLLLKNQDWLLFFFSKPWSHSISEEALFCFGRYFFVDKTVWMLTLVVSFCPKLVAFLEKISSVKTCFFFGCKNKNFLSFSIFLEKKILCFHTAAFFGSEHNFYTKNVT